MFEKNLGFRTLSYAINSNYNGLLCVVEAFFLSFFHFYLIKKASVEAKKLKVISSGTLWFCVLLLLRQALDEVADTIILPDFFVILKRNCSLK